MFLLQLKVLWNIFETNSIDMKCIQDSFLSVAYLSMIIISIKWGLEMCHLSERQLVTGATLVGNVRNMSEVYDERQTDLIFQLLALLQLLTKDTHTCTFKI